MPCAHCDFKSANSYYLDGKPIQTMHFQELFQLRVLLIKANQMMLYTTEEVIALQRMLQENTTSSHVLRRR
jgi:hypothetical protein